MRYSQNPIEDYFIVDLPVCSLRAVAENEISEALWNMLWLSNPTIDTLPGAGKKWYMGYKAVEGFMAAAIADLYADEELCNALMRSPKDFLNYWRNRNYQDYDMYAVGGDKWVATVTERAEEAMLRLMPVVEGNVVTVKFRKTT